MRKLAIFIGCALLIAGLQVPAIASAASETPPSPAATAYAKGQEHLAKRTADDLQAAIEDFDRAIGADASFAPAYAGLAEARALLYDYPGARQAALRALEIDERLASAHAVLGFSLLHGDWDWAGAEKELRRAVELDPQKATPHQWYAILLEATGRSEEAVQEARKAAEIQPQDANVRAGLGYRLYWARRYDEAVTELAAAAQLDPQLDTAHYFIGRARVQQGRFKEAQEAFDRAREISPKNSNVTSATAYMDALSGKRKQAQKVLSELEREANRGLRVSSQVAALHAALGKKGVALGWLERAQENHEGAMVWIKIDPGSLIPDGTTYCTLSPSPYSLGVFGVVAVRVEPQAMTEARFADELIVGHAPDEIDQSAMSIVPLPQHLGEGEVPFPLGHLGVERIDATIHYGIPRRFPAVEDERQMRQRLLFPPGHVRDDVSDRPEAGDARLHQLRV
jgi:tetratricopeptide (TPR) repeat protein